MKCYYHIELGTNPYENLALEELFFRGLGPDEVLLYLWQNENTVVIGRNQNAWRECRLDAFAQDGGRLARRLSGGGAVFHDLGNQNFTFLAPTGLYDVARQSEVIRRAVASFGIQAELSGRNDILTEGRKFSGNAYHQTKDKALHHGTILIDADMSRLGQYLNPSPEKLRAKGVESVRARVVNLCELNGLITPQRMRRALLEAFIAEYETVAEPLPQERIDAAARAALTEHYASDAWRLGRLSAFDVTLHQRLAFGELELQLGVTDGIVRTAKAYSDAMDADWVEAISAALPGVPYQAEALVDALPESLLTPESRDELAAWLREELN